MNIQNNTNSIINIPSQIRENCLNFKWMGLAGRVIKENRLAVALTAITFAGLIILAYVKSKQFPVNVHPSLSLGDEHLQFPLSDITGLQQKMANFYSELGNVGPATDPKTVIQLFRSSNEIYHAADSLLEGLKPKYLSQWEDRSVAFLEKASIDGSIESQTCILRNFEQDFNRFMRIRTANQHLMDQAWNNPNK